MFKRFSNLFLLIFIFFIPYKVLQAEDIKYYGGVETDYVFDEEGKVSVRNKITLINKTTEKYYPSYKINIENFTPDDIKVYDDKNSFKYSIDHLDNVNTLNIYFPDKVLGKGKERTFYVEYNVQNLAKRSGEVWEIGLPQLFDKSVEFKKEAILKIPDSFGEEAYIYPNVTESENAGGFHKYYFKNNFEGERIVAVFGKFQIYSFTLNYDLKNESSLRTKKTIAIPPDTSYQRMSYEKIDPIPENVITDADGNWLAEYSLNANEEVKIEVIGKVQVFSNPRTLLTPKTENLANNLRNDAYWEVDNENIKAVANNLKNPREIYDFVLRQLEYKNNSNNIPIRQGAVNALNKNLTDVKCTEFTDLFITLARANGIPSRELNGFASSDNSESKPLSLVNDLLHSWPEYWDEGKGYWVQIDPTWADTSGQNYFDNFDLKHITFVVHGENSKLPLSAGLYKQMESNAKDVFVNYGQPDNFSLENINLHLNNKIPNLERNINFTLSNDGKNALYDLEVKIFQDNIFKKNEILGDLPPYAKSTLSTKIPFTAFATESPETITVFINNKIFSYYDFKIYEILLQIIIVLLVIMVGVFSFLKFRHIKNL
ncbi:MAG TPA: transglutaminase domain-containing protein [Patescibacteria group bacterium]|nr:transglutaminase domain-containing protein [Patescibacteria group bacterium]